MQSQQGSQSLSADLSGGRSGSITSYSINLGSALCQLKVVGAIIWTRAELANYWPSMCYHCMWEWRHNVKIFILPDKWPCVFPQSTNPHAHIHGRMWDKRTQSQFQTPWQCQIRKATMLSYGIKWTTSTQLLCGLLKLFVKHHFQFISNGSNIAERI